MAATLRQTIQDNRDTLFPVTRRLWRWTQREFGYFLSNARHFGLHTVEAFQVIRKGHITWRHCYDQAAFIGVDSLGICLVMTTFSGMVIALQVAQEMVKQGAGNYVGALVSLAMLRELAPIMTGFSIIAMVGSAYAAELSTMKISSQIDALRVLHINPIRYLIVPRLVAAVVMLPVIAVITGFAGIMGGLLVSTTLTDLQASIYLDSVWQQTEVRDIVSTLVKSMVFGYLIAIISTTIGLTASGGAREVGAATTRAVVWCFVTMAIFDFILTYLIYGTSS